jgi:predicted regulator of Ras-like GTPase activity (Roadblock/LC7/MglB family)
VTTTFTAILRRAVDEVPNAIGGSFAAADGEMVDAVASGDPHDWALLTAHYGVVLNHLEAAFGTLHVGGPEYFVVRNGRLGVLVHTVEAGYFALLAVKPPGNLRAALDALRVAAHELRQEMR